MHRTVLSLLALIFCLIGISVSTSAAAGEMTRINACVNAQLILEYSGVPRAIALKAERHLPIGEVITIQLADRQSSEYSLGETISHGRTPHSRWASCKDYIQHPPAIASKHAVDTKELEGVSKKSTGAPKAAPALTYEQANAALFWPTMLFLIIACLMAAILVAIVMLLPAWDADRASDHEPEQDHHQHKTPLSLDDILTFPIFIAIFLWEAILQGFSFLKNYVTNLYWEITEHPYERNRLSEDAGEEADEGSETGWNEFTRYPAPGTDPIGEPEQEFGPVAVVAHYAPPDDTVQLTTAEAFASMAARRAEDSKFGTLTSKPLLELVDD
jgi:hypothetical protein